MKAKKQITVFEHQTIRVGEKFGECKFEEKTFQALQSFYGGKGVPYFSLVHKGVCFHEYVGVLQVGDVLIEVLPKADKKGNISESSDDRKNYWRDILIRMLLSVGIFDVQAPSSGALKIKPNSILDLYFAIFISEVEYIFHRGLVKKYRKIEENILALKGSLQFSKHISKNCIHQERFYVRHTKYDVHHLMHSILYKTIRLVQSINSNSILNGRINSLLLDFPEMQDIKVSSSTFESLHFNRKTIVYKKAIEISKLLLLRYHPDIRNGRENVLALMFDMNKLWEEFVYKSLRKNSQKEPSLTVKNQVSRKFWKSWNDGSSEAKPKPRTIVPDIVIERKDEICIVWDTKWKNLETHKVSMDDLRQMYVYRNFFHADKVFLVYPRIESDSDEHTVLEGKFLDSALGDRDIPDCSVLSIPVPMDLNIRSWQDRIFNILKDELASLDS